MPGQSERVLQIAASVGLLSIREWMKLRSVDELRVELGTDGATRFLLRRYDVVEQGVLEARATITRFEVEEAYAPEYVLWRHLEHASEQLGDRDAG